jgi:hypothetical protein
MSDPDRTDALAREWYLIAEEIRDRSLAARACESVLDIVKPQAAKAVVDAYTDYRKAMTADVEAAEAALWVMGKQQHKRDAGMNIALDLADPENWDLLTRYAPWSINVDIYDSSAELVATFHDCGYTVSAWLSAGQAARMTDDLEGILHIEPLDHPPARGGRR